MSAQVCLVRDLRQGEAQRGRGEAVGRPWLCSQRCRWGLLSVHRESGHTRLSPRPRELDLPSFPRFTREVNQPTQEPPFVSILPSERKLSFTCIESSGSRVSQTELSSKQGNTEI